MKFKVIPLNGDSKPRPKVFNDYKSAYQCLKFHYNDLDGHYDSIPCEIRKVE